MSTIDVAEMMAKMGIEAGRNGERLIAYAGATPWHGFGRKVEGDEARNLLAVRVKSGVNWSVQEAPLYWDGGKRVASHKMLYRDIDESPLGVVGSRYTVVQPDALDTELQAIIDTGDARADCILSLREGRTVVTSLALGGAEVVKGDLVASYLMLSNSYDGTSALAFGLTDVRVVCQNTHRRALASDGSKLFRFRHTAGIKDRVEAAAKLVNAASAQFQATTAKYRALAARGFSEAQLDKVVTRLFPAPKRVNGESKVTPSLEAPAPVLDPGSAIDSILGAQLSDTSAIAEIMAAQEDSQAKAREAIRELYETGRGTNIPGVRGTAWGGYNAITEYLSHQRGRTEESRMASNLVGADAQLGDKALETILDMVQVAA